MAPLTVDYLDAIAVGVRSAANRGVAVMPPGWGQAELSGATTYSDRHRRAAPFVDTDRSCLASNLGHRETETPGEQSTSRLSSDPFHPLDHGAHDGAGGWTMTSASLSPAACSTAASMTPTWSQPLRRATCCGSIATGGARWTIFCYELDLLTHLQRKGAPVSSPIPRKDGSFTHLLHAPEGDRYAVLFTYAPGDAALLPAGGVVCPPVRPERGRDP